MTLSGIMTRISDSHSRIVTQMYPFAEYMCITAEDYVDQSHQNLNPPATDPVTVAGGDYITYTCDSDAIGVNGATSYNVDCLANGLTFNYASVQLCEKLCTSEPPEPTGVVTDKSTATKTSTIGYKDTEYVR